MYHIVSCQDYIIQIVTLPVETHPQQISVVAANLLEFVDLEEKRRYIQVAKQICNSRRETTEKVALRYGESTKHRHKLCSSFLETPQVSPSHERVTGGAYQEAQLAGQPFSGGGWWGVSFSVGVCVRGRGAGGVEGAGRTRRSTLDARGGARGSVLGARRSHCRLERFQLCIAKLD